MTVRSTLGLWHKDSDTWTSADQSAWQLFTWRVAMSAVLPVLVFVAVGALRSKGML